MKNPIERIEMDTKSTIAIAVGSSVASFIFGTWSMKKVIVTALEARKPLLVSIVTDVVGKAIEDEMHGDELTAYMNEQLNFLKIVLRN